MKPEYVDEMVIDAPTAIKHKAICVRELLGSHYTQEELEKYCALYRIPAKVAEWAVRCRHGLC